MRTAQWLICPSFRIRLGYFRQSKSRASDNHGRRFRNRSRERTEPIHERRRRESFASAYGSGTDGLLRRARLRRALFRTPQRNSRSALMESLAIVRLRPRTVRQQTADAVCPSVRYPREMNDRTAIRRWLSALLY